MFKLSKLFLCLLIALSACNTYESEQTINRDLNKKYDRIMTLDGDQTISFNWNDDPAAQLDSMEVKLGDSLCGSINYFNVVLNDSSMFKVSAEICCSNETLAPCDSFEYELVIELTQDNEILINDEKKSFQDVHQAVLDLLEEDELEFIYFKWSRQADPKAIETTLQNMRNAFIDFAERYSFALFVKRIDRLNEEEFQELLHNVAFWVDLEICPE